jgi:hypothetical protein
VLSTWHVLANCILITLQSVRKHNPKKEAISSSFPAQ